MTDALTDQPTRMVAVDVVLPRSAPRRALAAVQVWLTGADGARVRLYRAPDGAAPTHDREYRPCGRFVGRAPIGTYVLCGSGGDPTLTFPPRPVELDEVDCDDEGDDDRAEFAFEVLPLGRAHFRVGRVLVGYDPARQRNLAAVVRDADLDDGAADRLIAVLGSHHYDPVIDLTRRPPAPPTDTARDPLVIEFTPRHPFAPKAGRLVRASAEIARRAELAPCMVRLGRVVACDGGRVVLDNEIVLGFWPGADPDDAAARIGAAGGRIVEDLSGDGNLIVVARFDDAEPERALAITERWLADGVLHWVEPNLVES